MSHLRVVLVAVLLLNSALITAFTEVSSVRLRYQAVKKQERLKSLVLENRTLLWKLTDARRPESLARRAAAFGIEVRPVRHSDVARPAALESVARVDRR